MPHEEPELKWSLTQAFEDFANFDIDDEKLAGRISQENTSFFRAFRDTDRLKVVKYAKLMQFDNHTVLFADLFGKCSASSDEDDREDEDEPALSIYDYVYVVDGSIKATSPKRQLLGYIGANEDLGKLRLNIEMKYGTKEGVEALAGASGCTAIVLPHSQYKRFAVNAQQVENTNHLGIAELSRRMQLLRKNPITSAWDNRKLSKVSNALKQVDLEPFQTYQEEGSCCKEMFVVCHGEMHLKKRGGVQHLVPRNTSETFQYPTARKFTNIDYIGNFRAVASWKHC